MSRGPINEVIHKINSENENNGKALVSKPGPKTLPKTGRGARPRNANMAYKEVSISGNHVQDIATATAEENAVLVSLSIHPSSNSTDIQGKDWVSYQAESKFLSPVESKENIQEKNGVLHANVPKSISQMQSTSSKQQYIYNINVVNRDHDMDLKPRSKPLPKPRYVRGARSSNTAVLSSTYSAQSPETTKHIDYSLPKAGIHVKTMPEYPIRQFETDSELNENDYILELDSKPTVAKKSTVTYVNWPIPAHVVENRGENSPYACRVVTTEKYSMPEDRFLSQTTADSGIEETVKNLSKCQSKPRETNGINLSEKMTVSDTANPKIENITEADMSKRNQANGIMQGPSPYHKLLGGTTAESNQKTANQYVNRYITSNGSGRMKVTFGTNDTTMECDGANFSGNTVQDTETITVNLSCIQNNNRTSYQTEPKFACILEQNETTKQEKCRFLQANFSTITKNMLYASTQSMCKNKSAKAVNNEAALAKPGPKQIPGYVREAIPKATTSTKNEAISPKTTSNINCSLSKVEIDTDYHPNSTRTCENEQDATDLCYSDNLLNLLPTSKTAYREKRPVPLPRKKKLARANSRIKIFGGHMQRFSLEQNVGIRKNSRIDQHESGTECASKTLPISDEVMYISPRRLTRQQNGVRRYHIVFDNPLYMTKVSEVHTKYPSYRHREHSHNFVEAYPPRIPPKQRPFNGTHTSTLGNMSSNFELQLKNDDQASVSGNEKHSNCGCVYNNLAECDERETPPKIPPKQRPFHSRANEGVWSNPAVANY
ncbi:uncharacterized protein LOC117319455 [Pecten maximus]|uniref:uncharacterized protein LOC117319455 n=1 Tax=Pecten maximus TaxID=6579 RepID=UPI00145804BB|nr:uncharacterized protein LOC117319455 [Pecten maximus]